MWKRWFRYVVWAVLLGVFVCAAMLAYIASQTREYIYSDITKVPDTEVAMVLGASVTSSGELSGILKERADEAAALYRAGKVKKILVTGDNGTVSHNEVDPTARYLVSFDVRADDIFLDHAGFDTYSSMYRARDVFAVTSVTIVSQDFHLPRAVYLARSMGLIAYGVEAPGGGVHLFNYVREIPATVKAVWEVVLSRTPKYLGPQYPITGDGRATWGSAASTSSGQATSTDILLL
ncbi:MAG: ElyC/SanA/YdcF family protein [bacterium]|nr:ElyC/SanA/YdcF family protein [bacterium]